MSSKLPTITTPKGIAIFPKLNEPDKKFNPEGVYSVTLRLPDAEAKTLIATLTKIHDAALAEEAKKLGKKNLKAGAKPWKTATDWDKDNETRVEVPGFVDFSFKLKAKVTTKSGKSWEQRPALFDARLQPLPTDADPVGGGSTIRVNFEVYPWYTASLGFGISLRPRGVQVIDLKTYGPRDAGSFGFAAEEDGYTFQGGGGAAGMTDSSQATDGSDEDGDF
jgi:hypothetical protein